MRAAFPGQSQDLKFEVAGLTVTGRISLPAFDQSLPVALAPEGVMTGLLHLTAVASAEPGCALAIDEVENSLHPHAIRAIVAAMRERAEEHDLTVLLATHSPVVIDQFKDHPDQLFVLEPGEKEQPIAVSKLRDPAYLAQFSLGDLYANERFGAPKTK
jgi:predicted ATPase